VPTLYVTVDTQFINLEHPFRLFPDSVLGIERAVVDKYKCQFLNYHHPSKMVVSSNTQVPGRMMYTPLIIKETQYIIPMQSELGGG